MKTYTKLLHNAYCEYIKTHNNLLALQIAYYEHYYMHRDYNYILKELKQCLY